MQVSDKIPARICMMEVVRFDFQETSLIGFIVHVYENGTCLVQTKGEVIYQIASNKLYKITDMDESELVYALYGKAVGDAQVRLRHGD